MTVTRGAGCFLLYNMMMMMMMLCAILMMFVAPTTTGFVVPLAVTHHSDSRLFAGTTATTTTDDLSTSERSVYDFLSVLQSSQYPFRTIVVSAAGSILESTQILGTTVKLSKPSGDAVLCTLCNDDQAFELHIKLQKVNSIALVEKEVSSTKTLRIIRLLNEEKQSLSSLILAESTDEAAAWFKSLVEKYGSDYTINPLESRM